MHRSLVDPFCSKRKFLIYSMRWCPWTILRFNEIVRSWWQSRWYHVPLPRGLCRSRLLLHWGICSCIMFCINLNPSVFFTFGHSRYGTHIPSGFFEAITNVVIWLTILLSKLNVFILSSGVISWLIPNRQTQVFRRGLWGMYGFVLCSATRSCYEQTIFMYTWWIVSRNEHSRRFEGGIFCNSRNILIVLDR